MHRPGSIRLYSHVIMLTLKLTPAEFRVLMNFLRMCTQDQIEVPLRLQSVTMLVLLQYWRKISPARLATWQLRRSEKFYKHSMPVAVAKACYDLMQAYLLNSHQQILLDRLDQAIINYQDPYAQPHVLGELVRIS